MAWFRIIYNTGEPTLETGDEAKARAAVRGHAPPEIARFTIDDDDVDPMRWAPRPKPLLTPRPKCDHPPGARVSRGGGTLAAPYGRESDPVYCDLCGEEMGE
jgi:hypothetical protein